MKSRAIEMDAGRLQQEKPQMRLSDGVLFSVKSDQALIENFADS